MAFTELQGIKCYYEKSGSGKPVVLLHGWGQNTEMMKAIALFLENHFTVYNLDLPGFGQSSEPLTPYGVEDYAVFLREFLEQFGVEDPILIGHSFGCRIALHYARKHPVHKMVLTGAAGLRDKRTLDWYMKTYTYKAGKKLTSLPGIRDLPSVKKKVQEAAERRGSEDYRNATGVMRATFVKVVNDDVRPFLREIATETLLVFGSNDQATPLTKGQEMEKMMPNAALVVFEGDDHYAYFHQAQRFNLVLEAFLKEDYAN